MLSWGLDVFLAFPAMIAIIALTAFLGPSLPTVILGPAVVFIPQVSRIARSTTRSFVHRNFVTASKAIGSPDARIMARDILPNIMATVIAFATTLVAINFVAEWISRRFDTRDSVL